MVPTQKEPSLLLYPSSSQRNSWCSCAYSRKWMMTGFKPILRSLWSHICDCSKYGTTTQSCPINHTGNSPLKLLGNVSHFSTSLWKLLYKDQCLELQHHFCHHNVTSLEYKRQCVHWGWKNRRKNLGPGWPRWATEVPGATHPQTSLTVR